MDAGGFGVTAIDVSVSAVTVNPFVSDATSFPLWSVTVRAPTGAVGSMLITTVALVAELTVIEPTVIPAPKLAVVDACAKCVACPVTATEIFC
jgi:hypothetical protein